MSVLQERAPQAIKQRYDKVKVANEGIGGSIGTEPTRAPDHARHASHPFVMPGST